MGRDEQSGDAIAQLRDRLRALRRRKWLVIACVVISTAAAVGYSQLEEPVYEATSRVLVRQDQLSTQLVATGGGSIDPERQSATDLALADQTALASRVIAALDLDMGPTALLEKLEPQAQGNSSLIALVVTDPDPADARRLANTFATEYVEFRAEVDRRRVDRALGSVEGRLRLAEASDTLDDTVSGENTVADDLRAQLRELELLRSLQTGGAEVIERASLPTSPAGSGVVRSAILGVFFGLLLGIGLALLRDALDRRVRTEEDVRAILPHIPIVAYLPGGGSSSRDREMAIEGSRTLHTNMTFLGEGKPLRTILVTSAMQGDGKTTTSINLALAMAEREESVTLIDADLRRRGLSERLGLDGHAGLSNLLVDSGDVDPFLVETIVSGMGPGPRGASVAALAGTLTVIPAGPAPPNPHALLSRPSFDDIINQALASSDKVILDGAPLGPISDMMPVARRVDGVLLIVRLLHSRRDWLLRVTEELERVGVTPVGIVLFGTVHEVSYQSYGPPSRGNGSVAQPAQAARSRTSQRPSA